MNAIEAFFLEYGFFLLGAAGLLSCMAIVFSVTLLVRHNRLARRYRNLVRLAQNQEFVKNLEKSITMMDALKERLDALTTEQERFSLTLRNCVRTPSVVRFNAFDDVGSDLSFSLAMLDGERNGFVFTSLYGREESRSYAKKIARGSSSSRLSPEEEQVLQEASSRV
ncbi:MAG: DUF4446 family protein [Bacillota bacterium]